MPREPKFTFTPLRKKMRLPGTAFAKVYATGSLTFNKAALGMMNVDEKSSFIHLYYDRNKRALAFRFTDEIHGEIPENVRKFTPIDTGTSLTAVVSIKNFLNLIDDVVYPTPRLRINEYQDRLMLSNLYYIVVPKGRVKEGEENDDENEKTSD